MSTFSGEIGGWSWKSTAGSLTGPRTSFEADRARDVKLKLLGYEVVRFTGRQLADRPAAVAGALRELLRK